MGFGVIEVAVYYCKLCGAGFDNFKEVEEHMKNFHNLMEEGSFSEWCDAVGVYAEYEDELESILLENDVIVGELFVRWVSKSAWCVEVRDGWVNIDELRKLGVDRVYDGDGIRFYIPEGIVMGLIKGGENG